MNRAFLWGAGGATLSAGVIILLLRREAPTPVAVATPGANEADAASQDAATSGDAGDRDALAIADVNSDADAQDDAGPEIPPSAWCASLRAANAETVARLVKRTPTCAQTLAPLSLECTDTPGGGWGLRIDKVSTDAPYDSANDGGCEPIGFHVTLVHRDKANGELTHFAGVVERWSDGGVAVNVSYLNFWGALSVRLRVYDLDGDGDPEAWLTGDGADEGPNRSSSEIVTVRAGAIATFAPLAKVDVHDIVDEDADGAWDVRTSGVYAGLEAESAIGGSYPVSPPLFLLHAKGDGGYLGDDAVALAAARKSCPSKMPAVADDVSNIEATVARVACARLRGAAEAAVVEALRKGGCKEFTDDYRVSGGCSPVYLRAAAVTPPFVLR